uniref:Uncharacterized protein n=1 Tax=Schizaphis graminum TaxID=13262 RepID=A0A2S2NZR2_SCHGA
MRMVDIHQYHYLPDQAGNSETVELCAGRPRERKSRGHAPSPRGHSRGMSTGTPPSAAARLRIYLYVILHYRSAARPSTSALGSVCGLPPTTPDGCECVQRQYRGRILW